MNCTNYINMSSKDFLLTKIHVHFKRFNTCHLVLPVLKVMPKNCFYAIFILPLKNTHFFSAFH